MELKIINSNPTADITLANNYAPYGNISQTVGNSQTAYGFTGEYTDSTGNVYLRARYYNPLDGRFITIDPSRLESNLYAYAMGNPINRLDPTGLFSELVSFQPGQEYGTIEEAQWLSDEMRLIEQATRNIAIAYARAYNLYALTQTPTLLCLIDSGIPPFLAIMLLENGLATKRIDPTSAFLRIHDGQVTFYKHSHRRVDPDTGEGDNTWGMGINKNTVNVFSAGEFDVNRYGKGNQVLADGNYIRFITHEMGHVFDHAINNGQKPYQFGRGAVPSELAIGNLDKNNGFCGTKTTYNEGWQWRFINGPEEYFADMFTGWVYQCWEPTSLQSYLGELRSQFMNENMPKWIFDKIEGEN